MFYYIGKKWGVCLYVGEKVGREGEKEETNSSKRKMKKRLTNDSLRCIIQQVKARASLR